MILDDMILYGMDTIKRIARLVYMFKYYVLYGYVMASTPLPPWGDGSIQTFTQSPRAHEVLNLSLRIRSNAQIRTRLSRGESVQKSDNTEVPGEAA